MEMLTCISRPRRFGKSYAAKMLCAYYDCSCDFHALFDDKELARSQGYLTHLNQYHVILLTEIKYGCFPPIPGMPLPQPFQPDKSESSPK